MTLKKCNECEAMISSSAKSCPQCGAKNPKTKLWLWIPLGLVVAFLTFGAMLPEDKARTEAIKFAETVKFMMKDPESFDVVQLRVTDIGAICLKYRAKNSFNAYLQNKAVKVKDGEFYVDGMSSGKDYLWNIYCGKGDGITYTF
jgi:ribosomal protein L40E